MYFKSLPDHTKPGFNEIQHFNLFKKHNVIFNAVSNESHCDDHVGCLSLKTVLAGEEWYGIRDREVAVRPGQFLMLNDDQNYSCHIHKQARAKTLSVFFKKEFASAVFSDSGKNEVTFLDDPFPSNERPPEFLQTLNPIDDELSFQLGRLISHLESRMDESTDELLIFLLRYLIRLRRSETIHTEKVTALKLSTRNEIYKRLCVAKDVLHSYYMNKFDLDMLSKAVCMSVPQLVRQFKAVFNATPHQYLVQVRLEHAAEMLRQRETPIRQITWSCGFEDVSAFSRAFKQKFGVQPKKFREASR